MSRVCLADVTNRSPVNPVVCRAGLHAAPDPAGHVARFAGARLRVCRNALACRLRKTTENRSQPRLAPGEFPFTKRLSALRLRNCLPALPFLAGSPGVPAEEQPTASGFAIQRPFNSAPRSAWRYVTRGKRVSCLARRFRVPLAAACDPRSQMHGHRKG